MLKYSPAGSAAVLAPERPVAKKNKYAELKQRMRTHGLLEKQPLRYTAWMVLMASAFVLGVALLFVVHNVWWQLLDAAFLAIVSAQISYIAHDSGHRQIYASAWKNDLVTSLCSLIMGISKNWWVDKHNDHHSH